MPAAIVNAWLDPLLREDAARDMKVLLDVREDLVATGFRAAWRSPSFPIRTFVGRTNELDVLPLNIGEWMNRDYAEILELCTTNAVAVRIFLSAPDEPWCRLLAHRMNLDAETIRLQLIRLPDQLLRAWDAASPHARSRIEIFFYDGVASTGITLCDGGVAVEIGPAVRDEEVRVPGHVLSFDSDSELSSWARRQVLFGSDQRTPTSAGLRPLPKAQAQLGRESDGAPDTSVNEQVSDVASSAAPGSEQPDRSENEGRDES